MSQAPSASSDASQEVLSRFAGDLRAFVRRRVAEADVDDVLQDVLVRIHRGLASVDDEKRIAGWVYRVARNVIVDHHRRRRPEAPLMSEPIDESGDDDPGDEARREVARWLASTVDELPEPHREALRLVEFDGISQRELAARLGLSPSGARTRVQRAREALRARILRCCSLELDRRGAIVDYTSRRTDCC